MRGGAKEFAVRQTQIDRAGTFIISESIHSREASPTKDQAHARNIFVLRQAQKVIIGYAITKAVSALI